MKIDSVFPDSKSNTWWCKKKKKILNCMLAIANFGTKIMCLPGKAVPLCY